MKNNANQASKSLHCVKPSLLLHACCAPCSTAVYQQLSADFDLAVFWFNPNIYPRAEYQKRLSEIIRLSGLLNFRLIIDGGADYQQFNNIAIQQFSREPEGGKRCELCYRYRLAKAFDYAKKNDYQMVTTTLTVSPHKNAKKILEIGLELERKTNVMFLSKIFREQGGYQRSIELSKEYNLYRQKYCGCEYSIHLKTQISKGKTIGQKY